MREGLHCRKGLRTRNRPEHLPTAYRAVHRSPPRNGGNLQPLPQHRPGWNERRDSPSINLSQIRSATSEVKLDRPRRRLFRRSLIRVFGLLAFWTGNLLVLDWSPLWGGSPRGQRPLVIRRPPALPTAREERTHHRRRRLLRPRCGNPHGYWCAVAARMRTIFALPGQADGYPSASHVRRKVSHDEIPTSHKFYLFSC
jgi:hypothetical protein